MRFVMLVPKSLDPVARGRKMPLPDPRPSEKIVKLFPPVDPLKDQAKNQKGGAGSSDAAAGPNATNATSAAGPSKGAAVTGRVPLPEARPAIKPGPDQYRHRVRQYRNSQ
jgi:membrane-bound lytic murein transglycosylase A